jgi:DNA processing protein
MERRSNAVYWLALQKIFYHNPRIAHSLLAYFGSPAEIFKRAETASADEKIFNLVKTFNRWDECVKDIKWCASNKVSIITFDDPSYPALLKQIYDPPILLMVNGEVSHLSGPCVAIVGARRASPYSKDAAFEIASELASLGIVVVSGMAYGIDAAAHRGALKEGATAAVWGAGPDFCYPPEFKDLSREISRNGCVVSEFPVGVLPFPSHFPQRNRIISGLSLGVVVVEAAARSGSLITARFALEQGREVFAVPGNARGKNFEGSNTLLKTGAVFVETGQEIIDALSPQLPPDFKNPRHLPPDVNNGHPILDLLEKGKIYTLDSIIEMSLSSAAEVLKCITLLVIENKLEELPGKRFRRAE